MAILSLGLLLLLLLVLVGLLLSLWIVIPAPIFSLMPLSVGAPEISLGLILLNTFALFLALATFKLHPWRLAHSKWFLLPIAFSSFALLLSCLPLSQFSSVQRQTDQQLTQALGQNYLAKIPVDVESQFRPSPLSIPDFFRGIAHPPIRETIDIPFANPDNVPLKLNVYRPEKVGQYPAIINIYGGAWQRGDPGQDAAFSRYIAAQGYVVWSISYRHAPQYQFPTQIEDCQSALKFIQQHADEYETDLDRLAVMGRSAGAQLASLLAYKHSPIPISAIVNYYGPVNLTAGYRNIPTPDPIGSRDTLRKFLGGTPDEFPDRYHQASPINAVAANLPPSLLIYGGKDHIIRPKYGKSLTEALSAKHNPVAFIEIPWADHAFDAVFSGVSNQLALYYTERFLAANLYGKSSEPTRLIDPGL
ncbi:alpha/beta hydrolase [filamentous cyanobacterium LEGE 11480]|uniref:Alpha/beta hydrolase n=1 Tax=Romeriopsis navalis LEGE 11480 TaxID=2777977 RepID=A0A928Z2Q8_9CYAN|nr:alpha/beta hydrolase [Romeriopsis navalis]MBE9028398.1 alpha/beta hydrolase [Romeriopsis navalis LEGE 11480]